jgi:hypothetical protein
MTKRQLIDDIRQFNTTVRPEFLVQFDEQTLQEYLDRLQASHRKRLQIESWSRPSQEKVLLAS